MTLKELRARAKRAGIPRYGRLPKAALERALAERERGPLAAATPVRDARVAKLEELIAQLDRLDPRDVELPAVGELLNGLDELLATLEPGPREIGARRGDRIGKLLEGVVLLEGDPQTGLAEARAELVEVRGLLTGEPVPAVSATASDAPADEAPAVTSAEAVPVAPAAAVWQEDEAGTVVEVPAELLGDGILVEFANEADDCLAEAEENLLALERNVGDVGRIDGVFRPIHTLKGAAGFLQLAAINHVCHQGENLLVKVRAGELPVTPDLVDLLLRLVDVLQRLLAQVRGAVRQARGEAIALVPVRLQPVLSELDGFGRGASPPTAAAAGVATGTAAVSSETRSEAAGAPETADPDEVVKVPAGKLDELSELVGELVVALSVLTASVDEKAAADRALRERFEQMSKATELLRERVLDLRMFPLHGVFAKLTRQVRDVARKVGKEVHLDTEGGGTLLDKSIIDELFAPLTHLVRNAIDHGLEPADERVAAGKAAAGELRLTARHLGDSVVVEVSDDGRGLDRERVQRKAVDLGLIKADAPLTDEVLHTVIFRPGVSTAKEVTDISGRGVGLDVVHRSVEALRGKIQVTSEQGKGSTFALRLPLTTSIIEGLIVRVGSSRFVLPILGVRETVQPRSSELCSVHDRPGLFFISHGRLLPILRLYDFYGLPHDYEDPSQGLVVVVRTERGEYGILVDELIHRQQVVIKNLGDRFRHLIGVTGGTILGDGGVGLILDPEAIALHHARRGDGTPKLEETVTH